MPLSASEMLERLATKGRPRSLLLPSYAFQASCCRARDEGTLSCSAHMLFDPQHHCWNVHTFIVYIYILNPFPLDYDAILQQPSDTFVTNTHTHTNTCEPEYTDDIKHLHPFRAARLRGWGDWAGKNRLFPIGPPVEQTYISGEIKLASSGWDVLSPDWR